MPANHWANRPFHPKKWPFFYGWVILLWGTIGILMSAPGQTIGVSVFTAPLLSVLGISRDQLSMAYMLGTIGSSLLLPWVGKLYDAYGARVIAIVASAGMGLTLLALSYIDRLTSYFLENDHALPIIAILFLLFLFLRFFGQGALTMASRNMTVQWFEHKRGLATGFSNVFVSLGFSIAPAFLYSLVQRHGWSGAWQLLALCALLIFPLLVFIFFRHKPEDSGLYPDGTQVQIEKKRSRKYLIPVVKQFTLQETRKNYSFWIFSFVQAMQALYITAFTFHVLSIFKEAGRTEEVAIHIFQPTAIVAVVVTLIASNISDYVPLKYLFLFQCLAACSGLLGVILLGDASYSTLLIVGGNGTMSGLFSVLNSVSFPRYFGRKHLGAISGQATMVIVFASALGPLLFSQSLTWTHSYEVSAYVCLVIYGFLGIATLTANNPQKEVHSQRDWPDGN